MTGSTTILPADTTQLERDRPGPPADSYRLRVDPVRSTSTQVGQPLATRFPPGEHSTTSRCSSRPTHTIASRSCWIRWMTPSWRCSTPPVGKWHPTTTSATLMFVCHAHHSRLTIGSGDRHLGVEPAALHCLKHHPTASRPCTSSPHTSDLISSLHIIPCSAFSLASAKRCTNSPFSGPPRLGNPPSRVAAGGP